MITLSPRLLGRFALWENPLRAPDRRHSFRNKTMGAWLGGAILAATLSSCVATPAGLDAPAASQLEDRSLVTAVRRITETQYRHAVSDAFGPGIKINARFEPDPRLDGLLRVMTGKENFAPCE